MMIEHTKSVRMGVKKSLLVIDLPYNTYRNKSEALKNSKVAIKETKCDAVKVEGGERVQHIVSHLVKNKIPVLGHIGLTPQTVKGKFKSVGKSQKEKNKLKTIVELKKNVLTLIEAHEWFFMWLVDKNSYSSCFGSFPVGPSS